MRISICACDFFERAIHKFLGFRCTLTRHREHGQILVQPVPDIFKDGAFRLGAGKSNHACIPVFTLL